MRLTEVKTFTREESAARDMADAEKLYKKMVALAKKLRHYIGHTDFEKQGDEYVVVIENSEGGSPGGFSVEMAELVKKSERAMLNSKREHKGSFDWASDTYIKPASEVRFKF